MLVIKVLFYLSEGQIPKGAIYVGSQKSQEGDVTHTDTYFLAPAPNDPTRERVVEMRKKEVRKWYCHRQVVTRCLKSKIKYCRTAKIRVQENFTNTKKFTQIS